jgi:anti-sigma factor RsiW
MRYLDGESDAAEVAEVERWLESSAEARALAAELLQVGDVVRSIATDRGAPGADVADLVMARIEDGNAGAKLRVVGAAGAGQPRRAQGRTRALFGLVPALGLAVAAAAAAVLFLRPAARPTPVAVQEPAGSVAATLEAAPGEAAASSAPEPSIANEPAEEGASIEEVDFGAGNGTIFMVPAGPEVTPVVWLMDDAPPSGRRMKPL